MPKGYRSDDEEVDFEDSDDESVTDAGLSKFLQGRTLLGRPVPGSIIQVHSSKGKDDDEGLYLGSESEGSEGSESESELEEESEEETVPTPSIIRPTVAKTPIIPRPVSLTKPVIVPRPSPPTSTSHTVVTAVPKPIAKLNVLPSRRVISTKSIPSVEELEKALIQGSGESKDFFEIRKAFALRMLSTVKAGITVNDLICDSRFLAQKVQTGVSYDPEVEIRLAKWLSEAL